MGKIKFTRLQGLIGFFLVFFVHLKSIAVCYVDSESHLPYYGKGSKVSGPGPSNNDAFYSCGPSDKNADLMWTPNQAERRALFDSREVQNSPQGCESYGHLLKAECNPDFPVLSIYYDNAGTYKIESFAVERDPYLNGSTEITSPGIKAYMQRRLRIPAGDWLNSTFLATIKVSDTMNFVEYVAMLNSLYGTYPTNDYRQAFVDFINGERKNLFFYRREFERRKPPVIEYTNQPYSISRNVAMTAITPKASGGAINDCQSTPALPAGLTLDSTTCKISGTPTVGQDATNYKITASNASGVSEKTISLAVQYCKVTLKNALPILTTQDIIVSLESKGMRLIEQHCAGYPRGPMLDSNSLPILNNLALNAGKLPAGNYSCAHYGTPMAVTSLAVSCENTPTVFTVSVAGVARAINSSLKKVDKTTVKQKSK